MDDKYNLVNFCEEGQVTFDKNMKKNKLNVTAPRISALKWAWFIFLIVSCTETPKICPIFSGITRPDSGIGAAWKSSPFWKKNKKNKI